MNQNLTETVFGISANLPQVYTASHFFCGIPLVQGVLLRNIPESLSGELILGVSGVLGDTEVIDFTVSIPDFSSSEYICEGSAFLPLNLEQYRILPKSDFISELSGKTSVKIRISASIGKYCASDFATVKFLPMGYLCPETAPELLCEYVLPGCDFAKKISKDVRMLLREQKANKTGVSKEQIAVAELIFSLILKEKLTYLSSAREIYDSECVLRSPDSILASGTRSMSLTEAALLYCSCAERCLLRPSIVFLRKGAGSVRVLVGIELKDRREKNVICESISQLRERIIAKEIILFDVLGFLGTEDTDFAKNVSETTELVFKTSSTLAFSADIFAARMCGIGSLRPFTEAGATNIYVNFERIADSVKKIQQMEQDNVFCGYSPYSRPSLGLAASQDVLKGGATYTLCALDDEIFTLEPDSISLITTFDGKYPKEKARNNSEQAQYVSRLRTLHQKIGDGNTRGVLFAYPTRYMLKCEKPAFDRTRDEFIRDVTGILEEVRLSEIKGECTEVYAAAGIVELQIKGETVFVPCMYVPCRLSNACGSVQLTYETNKPIFNQCLYDYMRKLCSFDEDLLLYSSDTDVDLGIKAFKELCEKCGTGVKLHPDVIISFFDMSYTLMRECLEKADGKKFEKYIESGKYESESEDKRTFARTESVLPFDCPSSLRRAVKCSQKDSVVISGTCGTGKKKAVANIISRAALDGENLLVCSKYGDSLISLYETMEEASLGELCLVVGDSEETKSRIFRDLERVEKEPEIPATCASGDISSLEDELAIYEDELYSEYSFGYSLYDCVNEYCKYDIEVPDMPIKTSVDAGNLSGGNAAKLFEISGKLSEKALEVSRALSGGSISEFGLNHIRTTSEIPKGYVSTMKLALQQLEIFIDKSAFASKALGISAETVTDLRTLCALGEFFELIMKSGVDYIPAELLGTGTYRSAKTIEKACEILHKLSETEGRLSDLKDRIPVSLSSELYRKWRDAENNPFVKNSITNELKKYLPDKTKLSARETGELLELLCHRITLEGELSLIAEDASVCLGNLWKGRDTDTEKALEISRFTLGADACIKKIFRNGTERLSDMQGGLSQLVSILIENEFARADFILALSAFKKLIGENSGSGLLGEISDMLSVDLYDIKFQNGIAADEGLLTLLSSWSENCDAIELLPKYNTVKKAAISEGLSQFVSALEAHTDENSDKLLYKSLYAEFANYIISQKSCFSKQDITQKYSLYRDLYSDEKKLAAYNLLCMHRKKFSDYVSSYEGKTEMFALRESLADDSVTTTDILSRHSLVINQLYSALLMTNTTAYRQSSYPQTLILLDSEKTSPAHALPLCANFDKCIFISSPIESGGNILSALPLGIPHIKLTNVLPEKNGHIAAFISEIFYDGRYTSMRSADASSIKFIKCSSGLYDKNSHTNKIEAVKVCETALLAAKEYGFENIGIIAFTPGQVPEINQSLELFANKYGDSRIGSIPVRFIGSLGDFSKDCIVLSVTFGKNIYSITRSFGVLDDISLMLSKSPCVLEKLLCTKKTLVVVSSLEPEEVPLDSASAGATALRKLLAFAKYCCAHSAKSGENYICKKLETDFLPKSGDGCIRKYDGTVTLGRAALLYENGYVKDAYDRIILPEKEALYHGYSARYVSINEILNTGNPTVPNKIASEK